MPTIQLGTAVCPSICLLKQLDPLAPPYNAAMDPFAGGVASLLVAASYVTSNMWMEDGGSPRLAAIAHLVGWLAQFYGHAKHEGRAPALLDNLFQVLLYVPTYIEVSYRILV